MDSAAAAACPQCSAALPPGARFCEQCGTRLAAAVGSTAQPAKPAARRGMLQRVRKRSLDTETSAIGKARACLAIIAGLLVVGTFIGWMGMESELGKVQSQGMRVNNDLVIQIRGLLLANGLLAVAFVGLAVWAGRNAFAAVLTGLVLYISLNLASAAVSPITLVQGIVLKIVIIGLLIGGIRAGLQQRRRRGAQTGA